MSYCKTARINDKIQTVKKDMVKIMIIGTVDEEKIRSFCAGFNARIDFNILCETAAQCDSYDAVFFEEPFDREMLKRWLGNGHLRIAKSEKELLDELLFFAGTPVPLEIERKFLVEMPEKALLESVENCRSVLISQVYCHDEKGDFRVRRRQNENSVIYIRTEKIGISAIKRIEKETAISREEYEKAICGGKVLSKVRWCFIFDDKYFELDVFPFWQDKAILEIELKSEDEQFTFPNFIKLIGEVTWDAEYKNSSLAEKYGVISD